MFRFWAFDIYVGAQASASTILHTLLIQLPRERDAVKSRMVLPDKRVTSYTGNLRIAAVLVIQGAVARTDFNQVR